LEKSTFVNFSLKRHHTKTRNHQQLEYGADLNPAYQKLSKKTAKGNKKGEGLA